MSSNVENTGYYLRIMSMYIDLGTETVLRVFLWLLSTNGNMDTKTFLNTNNTILSGLRKRGILNANEYNKLRIADPNPETFDVTLLMKLITHLFSNTVAVPSQPPQPKEYSLGSDLYRLRKFRNKLVHEPTSQIPKNRFEYLWKKISTVLVRVVQYTDPGKTEEIQNKLSRYKQMPLDPDDIAIKSKLVKLKELERERKRLKEQTEDLLKKATGFQLLLKSMPIEYTRYIRLLFDGGRLVLTGILERECNNSSNQANLVLEQYSEASSTKETQKNPSSMDVALLASIILDTFKTSKTLSSEEVKRITCLRDARNLYAHTALSSLGNGREYLQRWTDLIQSLTSLSTSLGGTTQDHCNAIIEQCTKIEDGDDSRTNMYLQQLQQHGTEVKSFAELYKENVDRLKQMLRQMAAEGERFLKPHEIEVKMVPLCENTEKKNEAEDRLENVFNTAFNMSPADMAEDEMMAEVVKFRQKISNHADVEFLEIKRKCILLKLTCSSCEGILHVLEYIESEGFQEIMDNIADELAFLFGDAYAVRGNVTLESLHVISNDPSNETVKEDGISLPVECSSMEGIGHVLTMLDDGETTNSVNNMAEILTHQLNEKISLTIYPDLKGFTDLFEETDTDTSGSGSLSNEDDYGREKTDNFENIIYEDEVGGSITKTLSTETHSPGSKGRNDCERKKSDKSEHIIQKDEVGRSTTDTLTTETYSSGSGGSNDCERKESDNFEDIIQKDEVGRSIIGTLTTETDCQGSRGSNDCKLENSDKSEDNIQKEDIGKSITETLSTDIDSQGSGGSNGCKREKSDKSENIIQKDEVGGSITERLTTKTDYIGSRENNDCKSENSDKSENMIQKDEVGGSITERLTTKTDYQGSRGNNDCERENSDKSENMIQKDEVGKSITETLTTETDYQGSRGSNDCKRENSDKSEDIIQKDEVGGSITETLTAEADSPGFRGSHDYKRENSDKSEDIIQKDEVGEPITGILTTETDCQGSKGSNDYKIENSDKFEDIIQKDEVSGAFAETLTTETFSPGSSRESNDYTRGNSDKYEDIIQKDEVGGAISGTTTTKTDSPGSRGSSYYKRENSDKSEDIIQKDEVGGSITETLTTETDCQGSRGSNDCEREKSENLEGTSESIRSFKEYIRKDISEYTEDINKKHEVSGRKSTCLRKHQSQIEAKNKAFVEVQIDVCPSRNTNQDLCRPNEEQMAMYNEKEESQVFHTDERCPNETKRAVQTSADILENIKQAQIKVSEYMDELKTTPTNQFQPEPQMVLLLDIIQMLLSKLVATLHNEVMLWKDMFKRQYAGLGTCPDLKNVGRWCARTGRIIYDLLESLIPGWFNVLVDYELDTNPLERCKENLGNLLNGFIASTFLVTKQTSCVARLEQKYLPELVVRVLAVDGFPQHTEEIKADILAEDDLVSCLDSDDFRYEIFSRVQKAGYFLCSNKVHFANVQQNEKVARFRRLKLESRVLHWGNREPRDDYEDKYRIIFTTTIYGKEFETFSLPFVLTNNDDQEFLSQPSIMWQYFLTKLSPKPSCPLRDIPWHLIEQMLQSVSLRLFPSRPLTERNLRYLKHRLLGNTDTDEEVLVSFKMLCLDTIDWSEEHREKDIPSCSFWKWFMGICNLIEKCLLPLWKDGLIEGFISTKDARKMLQSAKSGSYILRFSEEVTDGEEMKCTFGYLTAYIMMMKDDDGQRETFHDIRIGGPDKFRTMNLINILKEINKTQHQSLLYLYPGEVTIETLTEKYCNQDPQSTAHIS